MRRLVLTAVLALLQGWPAWGFETNGRLWPQMPVQYWINPSGCPVLPSGKTFTDVVAEAAAQWSTVPCAAVSFELIGTTTLGLASDGQNTFLCISQGWNCGAGAAGCNVWIAKPQGEPPENDIALNADTLEWVEGGPDATQTGKIDPVAVMTHELGHLLGLAHSPDPYATMYYASLPNAIQATLDGDDRAGICTLYPNGQAGCTIDNDCATNQTCATIQGQSVCDDLHDGPGAFCSKTDINCAGMCWVSFFECSQVCLFTSTDYTDGYCAPLCDAGPCPPGFTCEFLSQYNVHVCFEGTATDGSDGGDGSSVDDGIADGDSIPDGAADGSFEEAPPAGDDGPPGTDEGQDAGSDSGADGFRASGGGCGCGNGSPPVFSLVLSFVLLALLRLRRR